MFMEDPMVPIDPRKLRMAIQEKFGTLAKLFIYLQLNEDKIGKGFSSSNLEHGISQGKLRKSTLDTLAELLDRSYDYFLPVNQVPWTIPAQEWGSWRPPGSLLRAEFEIVRFQFREREMQVLKKWCYTKGNFQVALKLFTGKGGMGKTRLALQLCREMQKEGWRAGFLDYGAFRRDEQRWGELLSEEVSLLLVLDYAEHRVEELSWLLPVVIARTPRRVQVRLLLLARDAGDFWTSLKSMKEAGDLLTGGTSYMDPLEPLTVGNKDRAASWRAAATEFARRLGKSAEVAPHGNLGNGHFDRVLLLHMDALAAVEGAKPEGRAGVLDYVLSRERRFWAEHLKARNLHQTLLPGLENFMASVTATKGISTPELGLKRLRGFKFFKGQPDDVLNALNEILSECYPGRRWIEPLEPDLLGDHLINRGFANGAFGEP